MDIDDCAEEKLSSKSTRWSRSTVALVLIVVALCSATALLQTSSSPQSVADVNKTSIVDVNSWLEKLVKPKQLKNKSEAVITNEWSNETEKALKQLVDYVDKAVDPCEDFFEFSCGNSQKGKDGDETMFFAEPRSQTKNDLLMAFAKGKLTKIRPPAVEAMYRFYDECSATVNAPPDHFQKELRAAINKLGGIPLMLGDKWKEVEIGKTLDALLFWNFMPFVQFWQLLPPHRYSFKFPRVEKINGNILRRELMKYASLEGLVLNENTWLELDEMVAFIDKLSEDSKRPEPEQPVNLPLGFLSKVLPEFNITKIARWMYPTQNHTINELSRIFFWRSANDTERYFELFQTTSPRVLTNYALISFYLKYKNIERLSCLKVVVENYVMPLNYVYLKQNPADQKVSKRMIDNIISAFRENLKKYEWLDDETRKNALKKLDNMLFVIGQPDIERDMEEFYTMVPNMTDWGLLQRFIWMEKFTEELGSFESERREMVRSAQFEVNASYWKFKNAFFIYRAIMNPHLFHEQFTPLLNYARLGKIIAHEMIHGFDNDGRRYNEIGAQENWWTDLTTAAYEEKAKCFEKLYESEYAGGKWMRENGTFTLGENLADGGGFIQAFQAYKRHEAPRESLFQTGYRGYSGEQLFMIASAQTWCGANFNTARQLQEDDHSLLKFRVNLNFRNHNEFAEAFQCEIGTKMNPIRKDECHIW